MSARLFVVLVDKKTGERRTVETEIKKASGLRRIASDIAAASGCKLVLWRLKK